MHIPRLIISGLSGGAGKTMLSLGLARAFARQGVRLRAFKKGPDYIDAAWLARAAQSPQATLDPFFSPGAELAAIFARQASGYDLAIIEGNRGLFDGLDIDGSCSTAEVSRLLRAPVILVLDCTKMTRTVAAVVRGCLDFEQGVRIGGVILNRTGNERHQAIARRAVEELAAVSVLGALPRRAEPFIAERHMGLAGLDENGSSNTRLDALADFIADNVDLNQVLALAKSAPDLDINLPTVTLNNAPANAKGSAATDAESSAPQSGGAGPRIGYVFDAAFWFYYRENIDALKLAGARLVPVSLLEPGGWPDIDGLYIGGGLPEMYAEALSANYAVRERVARLVDQGLPVYAECGGFMYLARNLVYQGRAHPMAGAFALDVEFCPTPQGLGYVEAEVMADSPCHPKGSHFRGHEFHFSRPVNAGNNLASQCLLHLHRGRGMAADSRGNRLDGLLKNACFAAYTHIYAPAVPHWAPGFVRLCKGQRP